MSPTDTNGDASIAILRDEPSNLHLLRGFGPLVVAAVLILLMTLLAPTVAPEERIVRPVNGTTVTTRAVQ